MKEWDELCDGWGTEYLYQIQAIRTEIETYHKREGKEDTAYLTIELIDKILDGSYFTTNSDKEVEA